MDGGRVEMEDKEVRKWRRKMDQKIEVEEKDGGREKVERKRGWMEVVEKHRRREEMEAEIEEGNEDWEKERMWV